MHAIIQGAQRTGDLMKGGKLYCTTYPCHNCARHIIAAGIEEVYYIQPYEKSRCLELHGDAITDDEKESGKVKILMFDGVSPRRYIEFFELQKSRKNKDGLGTHLKSLATAKPKSELSLAALPNLEQQAIHSLQGKNLGTGFSS